MTLPRSLLTKVYHFEEKENKSSEKQNECKLNKQVDEEGTQALAQSVEPSTQGMFPMGTP